MGSRPANRREILLGQKVTEIIATGFAERLIADRTRSAADALAQQIGIGIEVSTVRVLATTELIAIIRQSLGEPERPGDSDVTRNWKLFA